MVNVEDTLAIIDTDIATYWQNILSLENAYFNTNGKYIQTVSTHNTLPIDGIGSTPENLVDSPSDQVETWNNLVTLPNIMSSSLVLNVYETPVNWGWVAIFEATINGTIWRKMIDQGNQEFDLPWYADDIEEED